MRSNSLIQTHFDLLIQLINVNSFGRRWKEHRISFLYTQISDLDRNINDRVNIVLDFIGTIRHEHRTLRTKQVGYIISIVRFFFLLDEDACSMYSALPLSRFFHRHANITHTYAYAYSRKRPPATICWKMFLSCYLTERKRSQIYTVTLATIFCNFANSIIILISKLFFTLS